MAETLRTAPGARTGIRRRPGRPSDPTDVRESILAATLRQLVAAGGPEEVTIASVVTEAGCTPPSLYHYWPTRDRLLYEASLRGWAQFRVDQATSVAQQDDPLARLRARGLAYVNFALARPGLFRVLFLAPSAVDPDQPPSADAGQALLELVADVTQAMDRGLLREADPFVTALALWSAMHGVAALWVVDPRHPAELAHRVAALAQDAILTGLAEPS